MILSKYCGYLLVSNSFSNHLCYCFLECRVLPSVANFGCDVVVLSWVSLGDSPLVLGDLCEVVKVTGSRTDGPGSNLGCDSSHF